MTDPALLRVYTTGQHAHVGGVRELRHVHWRAGVPGKSKTSFYLRMLEPLSTSIALSIAPPRFAHIEPSFHEGIAFGAS